MRKLAILAVALLVLGGASHLLRDELVSLANRDDLAWLQTLSGSYGQAFAASRPSPYATTAVERGEIRETVTATGTLNALVTVKVGTQLSGQVAELFADFNDMVKKDQPLAQLDSRGFEARLAQARAARMLAEANVEVQRAKLARARIKAREAEAERPVLQARTDNARVKLNAAESALSRANQLSERGAYSPTQVEEAQTARDSAAANLREAEALAAAHELAVDMANSDLETARAELNSALAGVPEQQALERFAEIDLERATIRSPVDGIVVGRDIDEGQTVAAALEAPTLFTIAGDLRQMEIYASIDEADIGKIRVGQKSVFTVDAYPGRQFLAVVKSIRRAPQLVQDVVTYTVVLTTENPDDLLLPGMTATVRITVHESGAVLKVPMAALRYTPRGKPVEPPQPEPGGQERLATVWVLGEDGEPSPLFIGIGSDDGANAELVKGSLSEGDQLIVREVVEAAPRQLFGMRLGF